MSSESEEMDPVDWRSAIGLADIEAASRRLEPLDVRTPLQLDHRLSDRFGAEIWLKREDLQTVRSYKIRGAYNFIAGLTAEEAARGVVCASAGNHAQGVAWSCRRLGISASVFLPRRTPRQKVDRIRSLGGSSVEIHFVGESFDEAAAAASEHAHLTEAVVAPGFDHPAVVAGQGTTMLEAVEQLGGPPDLVVVPVGGGGLISGVAVYLEGLGALAGRGGSPASDVQTATGIQTAGARGDGVQSEGLDEPGPGRTVVLGAQPTGAPGMIRSLEVGRVVTVDLTDDFVDGAAVRTPGRLTLSICRDLVSAVVAVDEGRVCTEQLELYQQQGIVAEPAGALSLAALDQYAELISAKQVVCILSGGNNDVARYDEIIERSLVHRGLKHYFLVQFPQTPGALRHFLDYCLGPSDDITLFEYTKKSNRETGPALVGIELLDRDDLEPLMARMSSSGLDVERLEPGSAAFRLLV